jgi:hypothetical protein
MTPGRCWCIGVGRRFSRCNQVGGTGSASDQPGGLFLQDAIRIRNAPMLTQMLQPRFDKESFNKADD